MKTPKNKIRTIMKYDVGADGFLKMIFVLAASAVVVLAIGAIFLSTLMKDLKAMP